MGAHLTAVFVVFDGDNVTLQSLIPTPVQWVEALIEFTNAIQVDYTPSSNFHLSRSVKISPTGPPSGEGRSGRSGTRLRASRRPTSMEFTQTGGSRCA